MSVVELSLLIPLHAWTATRYFPHASFWNQIQFSCRTFFVTASTDAIERHGREETNQIVKFMSLKKYSTLPRTFNVCSESMWAVSEHLNFTGST